MIPENEFVQQIDTWCRDNNRDPKLVVDYLIQRAEDQSFDRLSDDALRKALHSMSDFLGSTHHLHALAVADALTKVFQRALDRNIDRWVLTVFYNVLYLAYWCGVDQIERQRGFHQWVALPFEKYLIEQSITNEVRSSFRQSIQARRKTLQTGRPLRVAYMAQYLTSDLTNGLKPAAIGMAEAMVKHAQDRVGQFFVYGWQNHHISVAWELEQLGATVRKFSLDPLLTPQTADQELAAIEQSLFEDQIDILITDMNSAVPHLLFARRLAPIQIFYQFGMPFWPVGELDGMLQGWRVDPNILELSHLPHVQQDIVTPFPLLAGNPSPAAIARVREQLGPGPIVGTYTRLVKASPDFLDTVAAVLERNPTVKFAIGGNGDPTLIETKLKARFPNRVIVIPHAVDGHAWGKVLDIFLDTFPLTGGFACLETLAKGTPIIFQHSLEMPNLTRWRDQALASRSAAETAELVASLLSNKAALCEAQTKSIQVAQAFSNTEPLAHGVLKIFELIIGPFVPSSNESPYAAALQAFGEGRVADALNGLLEAFSLTTDNAELINDLAVVLHSVGDTDIAFSLLSRYLGTSRETVEVLVNAIAFAKVLGNEPFVARLTAYGNQKFQNTNDWNQFIEARG